MSKIIGIDLGTTNSCVAVMEAGNPVIIPNAEGQRTTPSVVAFSKNNERLIGEPAKRQALVNSKNTISSIKRKMGSEYKVDFGGSMRTPQEISAMILQKLKSDAEKFTGESIEEAVITVPAYFNDAQRQATKDAGRIAGLNVKRIINEPTAAAIAYGINNTEYGKILVYDFGGGTLDVSIIESGDGVLEVISTAGNNHLGGDDIDEILASYIADQFMKTEGIQLKDDPMAWQRIMDASETAKKDLSSAVSIDVNIPFITQVGGSPKHIDMTISRSTFEEIISDVIEKAKTPVKTAVSDASISYKDISKILLVGGSTRIPCIQDMLFSMFGKAPEKNINPDECVAAGAAIHGNSLTDKNALLLIDVIPLTLSVKLSNGTCKPVIKRNQTVPSKFKDSFTTNADYQDNLWIQMYQGERLMAKDNFFVGDAVISGILPAPKGVPDIEISFMIDENGIINIDATEKNTHKRMHTYIKSSSLSEDEIQRAICDAERYANEDKINKEKSNIANSMEAFLIKTKSNMQQYDFNETEKMNIFTAIERAEHAIMEKSNMPVDALEESFENLKSDINECYSSFYKRSGATVDNPYSGSDTSDDFYENF